MKKIVTIILSLVIVSCAKPQKKLAESENFENDTTGCDFAFGPVKAIACAHIADEISGYDGEWPPNTNSTFFFKQIEGNLNLKSINFCGVFVDSLTSSIGRVPNLETLQL